ncbi:hypothetical protein G1L02_01360 [Tenacibaculum finnmarkense]|uniref:restriction endonuclease subunit S n=1 Tax=Tenacibaculum finnmarkense TaxID=2781243 RepID=UPI001EFB379A|nr:restriction endonuclease subunit S [Tenacibaculum finnmarkense]MCG8881814.1 hypothetical protein [Tenacibaculum finnmarkense]
MIEGYLIKKLGGIPNNWKESLLSEVSWFQEGPGLRKWQFREEGIKVINITNMVNGFLDLSKTNRYISKEEFKISYTHFECQEKDIVVASSGNSYCKHAIVRKQDLPLVMNTSVIRFKPLSGIVYDYLNQFLKSSFFKKQIDFMITGGAQPNFGPVHLNKVVLPLPPLKEQQKIAEILSTVDAKISIIDEQISENQNLKKGLMQSLLSKGIGHTEFKKSALGEIPKSWEVLALSDFTDEITDYVASGSFASLRENVNVYTEPNYAIYVRLTDLRKRLGHTEQKYVDKDSYNFLSKSNLSGREILFANIGANVGEVWMMPQLEKKATVAPNMIVIRANNKNIISEYLHAYLSSSIGVKQINKIIAGSGHPKINKTDLRCLLAILPPLKEQQKIASILSSVDEKLGVLSEKKSYYQNLKKGLMQQLLTGLVRVSV